MESVLKDATVLTLRIEEEAINRGNARESVEDGKGKEKKFSLRSSRKKTVLPTPCLEPRDSRYRLLTSRTRR